MKQRKFSEVLSVSRGAALAAALIGTCVALAPLTAQAATNLPPAMAKIRDSGVITIANRPDAFPVAYLDENKQPIGYGIDLCREIVRAMERDLKKSIRINWVEVNGRTRFETVATGKADMECGNTINDPQRRKTAGYSIPYLFTGPRYLVRSNSNIHGTQDLQRKRVAVVAGTNSIPLLQTRIDSGTLNGTTLREYKGYDEATAALMRGDADAFATLELLLAGQRARARNPADLAIVGTYLALEPAAILLRKDDAEFKRTVDRHLAALMLDGTVARYYDKWFLQPIPPSGLRMELPMSSVMRDQLRWPTDRNGDELTR